MTKPKNEEKKKRVGIWIRVSTEDQAKGESPEHHEQRARYYAEIKEWKIIEVYELKAVSGKSVLSHPETKRMLKDIKDGHITGLIFSKLARLARNTRELLDISDIFRDHDADLISLQESIDTTSPAGRLFYTMIAAMAQWEREEISERVAASVPIRAKLGKPLGGQAPFGYQWKDRELIPDPKEAPVRKLMYELFLEHKRKKTVARILNEMGYRTRNGSKFSDTTVNRLLQDPTAKGLRRANYTKSTGDGKHWVIKPKEDWVHTKVEPIVDKTIWDQCHAILKEQYKSRKPPSRKTVHLFSGIAFCNCGEKMYVPSNSPKYTCQKCRNKIPVDVLEAVFHEQLNSFFFSSDDVMEYIHQADEVLDKKVKLLEVLENERKQVQKKSDTLFDLYYAGEIPKEGFGKKHQPIEEQLQQLDDQMPELQGEIDFLKIEYLSSDQIIADAKDLYSRWEGLDQEEKRNIVETITEEIIIGEDEVSINLCYLPNISELAATRQRKHRDSSPRLTGNEQEIPLGGLLWKL
jgi:site-specific DNA recombinase